MVELAISNWLVRALILVLLFAAVVAVVMFATNWVQARSAASRQFAKLGRTSAERYQANVFEEQNESRWARLAERVETSGLSLTDDKNDNLKQMLKAAGYRNASAPRVYTLVRMVLVFVLPGIYLLSLLTRPEPPSPLQIYITSAILALLGLYLPFLFVRAKADRRKEAIINGFPDALDLLLVCVEAGLGLEAALDRVGRELSGTHPLISEMFVETTLLMRAGASREDSLRKLADSAGVDEIRSFATLLIQSDKLGTSIASTLRVYAAEMREARRMRAEEKAHRLPVLISIPLVTCMLPTMIGVLILPAAVAVVREIGPALTGG